MSPSISSRALPIVMACALVALVCACGSAPSSTPTPSGGEFGSGPRIETPQPSAEIVEMERAMLERINADRAQQGLPALVSDGALADAGRRHSADMAANAFLEHESPTTGSLEDRLTRAGVLFVVARENLALAGGVDEAQDSLLQSPGHRENLFSQDISHVGVGIVPGTWEGEDVFFFTQVFAVIVDELEPDDVSEATRAAIVDARAGAGFAAVDFSPRLAEVALDAARDTGRPDDGDLQRVAERLVADGLPIGAISVMAQTLYQIDGLELTPNIVGPTALAIGIGAAPTRDERGRPAVQLVVIIAESAP